MADGRANLAFANGERVIDVAAVNGTLLRAQLCRRPILDFSWLIDIANTDLPEQPVHGRPRLPGLDVPVPQRRTTTSSATCSSSRWPSPWSATSVSRPRRRACIPEYGFIDTVNAHSSVNHDSALAKLLINPFAAVPSMHCAVALMIGGTGFMVCKNRFARAFWACWPLLVAWVTIVTANHYWVDAVLGWMVAGSRLPDRLASTGADQARDLGLEPRSGAATGRGLTRPP